MNVLFTNFPSVPIYGVADVHSVNHIVQYMDKETQYQDQQHPCQRSHKVRINPKIAHSL